MGLFAVVSATFRFFFFFSKAFLLALYTSYLSAVSSLECQLGVKWSKDVAEIQPENVFYLRLICSVRQRPNPLYTIDFVPLRPSFLSP